MAEPRLLVDARAITHATAGGRGIGNYTAGLLVGLGALGVPTTALVEDATRPHPHLLTLPSTIEVAPWGRRTVRSFLAAGGTDFVATGMFLPPLTFDPIPQAVTEAGLRVTSIAYDVIPMRHPEMYLRGDIPARLVRLRGALARTVDLSAAISCFAAATSVEELGLDPATVHVIGAGVGPAFRPPEPVTRRERMVLAVTGPDPRKNTEGIIQAWARLPVSVRAGRRLVVVAGGSPGRRAAWHALAQRLGCHDVELSGPLGEAALVRLMQRTELSVQPSIDEGFGLPVLEAAACGAVGICSNASAMPEVLDEPAATFDPHDPVDMAGAIVRALSDGGHRERLLAAGRRAVERWRWDRVATDLVGMLDLRRPRTRPLHRRRVAVVGPPGVERLATAVTRVPETEVVRFIDAAHDVAPVAPSADGTRWPAAMLGRSIPLHDFDHVITLVDGDRSSVGTRLASRGGTHVWLREGRAPESFPLARSFIVEAERQAATSTAPTGIPALVLGPTIEDGRVDGQLDVLARWLSDADVLAAAAVGVGAGGRP